MSHSQFHSIEAFILRHAWLSLWDKHMTTGRINQVTIGTPERTRRTVSLDRPRSEGRPTHHTSAATRTAEGSTILQILGHRLTNWRQERAAEAHSLPADTVNHGDRPAARPYECTRDSWNDANLTALDRREPAHWWPVTSRSDARRHRQSTTMRTHGWTAAVTLHSTRH